MLWSAVWIWDCCLLSHSHTRNNLVVSVCHRAGLEILEDFWTFLLEFLCLPGSQEQSELFDFEVKTLKRFNGWGVTFFKELCVFPCQLWAFLVIPHGVIIDRIPVAGGFSSHRKSWGQLGRELLTHSIFLITQEEPTMSLCIARSTFNFYTPTPI